MIATANIVQIVAAFMGLWLVGFGFGKAAAWVRAIRGAA